MATPREAIFVALLARLTAITAPTNEPVSADFPLRTASRILLSFDECGPALCPRAAIIADGEERIVRRGFPAMVKIKAQIVVVVKNDQGRDVPPSTKLNNVLSAIEDALHRHPTDGPAPLALFPNNPDQTFGTTLGGLCYTCSIGSAVEIAEGFQGSDGLAIIPVDIFTTDAP